MTEALGACTCVILIILCVISLILLVHYYGEISTVTMPWEPEVRDIPQHQHYIKETKAHAKDIEIVFYGDSITHFFVSIGKEIWDKHYVPLHAVNYAIGGDRIGHLIWRIQNGEVEGLHPKVVVLKIATNNLGSIGRNGVTEADIAKGIKTVVDLLLHKMPHTKVLLLGILPRSVLHGDHRQHIIKINSILKTYDNGHNIRFLNMDSYFEDKSGNIIAKLYTPDGVHLEKPGYEVWAQTMDPFLKQILK